MKVRQMARRDANHNEIADTVISMGASWLDLSRVGGALDGLIGVAGIDQRIEIKDGSKFKSRRNLTKAEKNVFEEWRGRRPVIVESAGDVIKLINQLRRKNVSVF